MFLVSRWYTSISDGLVSRRRNTFLSANDWWSSSPWRLIFLTCTSPSKLGPPLLFLAPLYEAYPREFSVLQAQFHPNTADICQRPCFQIWSFPSVFKASPFCSMIFCPATQHNQERIPDDAAMWALYNCQGRSLSEKMCCNEKIKQESTLGSSLFKALWKDKCLSFSLKCLKQPQLKRHFPPKQEPTIPEEQGWI